MTKILNTYDISKVDSYDNIADLLKEENRMSLAGQLIAVFNSDETSRAEKKEKTDKIVKLAMMIYEEKNYPFEKASNVIMPIIAEASISFGSTAYPGIIRDDTIVISKVIGNDEGKPILNLKGEPITNEDGTPKMQDVGLKQKTGERIAKVMNWQLTEDIDNWQEELRKLCYCLPIVGTLFKKVWYDTLNNKIAVDLIFPDKIIINDNAKISKYTTITHILEETRHEIIEKIRSGIYLDLDYFEGSDKESEDEDSSKDEVIDMMETYEFLEMHCWADLDDDGFSEPYIVTISKETEKIARIVARFTEKDITKNKDGLISHIKCEEYIVMYGFIPSFDGSYFDIGYGHLLYGHNNAINSAINQLLDAGHLKNAGGGLLSRGIRIKGGTLRFKPNEWKYVDTNGQALRDNIFPMPVGEPSPTLFQLMDYLVQSAMRLSAVSKILKGDIPANLPAETIPAVINEASKDFKSVYKSIYLSLKKEFKLMSRINRRELPKEIYKKVLNDDNADKDKDFKEELVNIVPVADPESIINIQRVSRAVGLMALKDDPFINQVQIRKDLLESYNINNTDDYIVIPQPPPPPPNPLAEAEQVKLEGKKLDLQIKAKELQIKEKELQLQLMIKVEKEKAAIVKTMAETEKIEAETREIEKNTNTNLIQNG